MTEVTTEELVHVYADGDVRALDGVDLHVPPGQRVALVGQNGSGKTTLVKHFIGLLRPTSGRVSIDGRDISGRRVAELAHDIGLVFQDPSHQIFSGTVRGEVEFGPRNLGMRGRALRRTVDEALHLVGLGGEARTNPYDLGAARRKLLALASVLAMHTPVLVLDEPTTGQDLHGVALVRDVVAAVAAEGRTVIAITHDMEFAADAFERVVVLREGRTIVDAPPASAFASESWPALRSTHLEPPLAATVGARLDLGSTPTDADLIDALRAAQ